MSHTETQAEAGLTPAKCQLKLKGGNMISYEIQEAGLEGKKKLTIQKGLLPNSVVLVISYDDGSSKSIIVKSEDISDVRW